MRITVAFVWCAAVAATARGDWPEFRGPMAMGHAAVQGLPLRWSERENVVWKTPIPGLGWSSPVVHGDRVYLTTATEPDGDHRSLRLVCLDARTGGIAWDKELFTQPKTVRMHAKNSHASPTPLVAGDRLIVHFGPYGTAGTTLDGEIVWQRKLSYAPMHGTGGSPARAGDVIVICCDGNDAQYVVGLDLATGDVRWKTDRDTEPGKGFSFATPLVTTVDGTTQAICPGSDAVFAYDPATGRELWRVDYPGGHSVIPRPVVAAGLVFVGSGYDKPTLYAIDPTGRGNVTTTHVRWQLDRGAPHTPSVVVVGQELYCVSDAGVATCLDARTGAERWRERLGGNYSASPLHADGAIYFQNETGEAVVVKAGPVFEELARNRLGDGERTFASYAVAAGGLLVRSESALYRIARDAVAAGLVAEPAGATDPNTLTAEEAAAGFELLFNGRDLAGWKHAGNWEAAAGVIARAGAGGGIVYDVKPVPDDFELRFEWKVAPKSNSGVYYRPGQYEYQILDNALHADGRNPRTSAAALYYALAPRVDATRPVGEWNEGRIVCQGTVVEHWLNGQRVVSFDYADPRWAADVERLRRRGGTVADRGAKLSLQDHGDPVWYRSLRLRTIPATERVTADPTYEPAPVPPDVEAEQMRRLEAAGR